ncbi:putative F-box/LRR-repeat protein 8 [Acorus calamus]|uniref:F-box/LRR-repeat protein 8 n=1 Tax=Acorus calamus TaxID=4465 RepID=A0AAV9CUV8_ACOCL|nr:putative F-box/LRR-repeat protein 8 [Acorus calamus]
MGQSSSTNARNPSGPPIRQISARSMPRTSDALLSSSPSISLGRNYTSDLPDECLALVFHSLGSGDRKNCSLVCHRWLLLEGQSRHRLSLDARSALLSAVPSLFSRFDSVTKLALKCERRSVSIGDEALVLISLRCRNLTRFKLRACREITDAGVAAFVSNCGGLRKLSCGSCAFGSEGVNAVLESCPNLEELSIKRLRGLAEGSSPIGPGKAAASLKVICLKELYNGQCFGPLIIGSKNLRTLKLFRCSGEWDQVLDMMPQPSALVEVHLERIHVSDRGLSMIASSCGDLEVLHLVKTPECTNAGLASIADRCRLLRKLHIDGWKTNRIGDEGLSAVARQCPNLQELVLIGVNPTVVSLGHIAGNCKGLQRLALCGSETIGDSEISCIAAKCVALRKLCIKGCPVSDNGMEALAGGCPNLVKVKVKKCRGVTPEGADSLRASRGSSLAVNLDMGSAGGGSVVEVEEEASENGAVEANAGDEGGVVAVLGERMSVIDMGESSSSGGRPGLAKVRHSLVAGRNFVTSTFRRWSNGSRQPQSSPEH